MIKILLNIQSQLLFFAFTLLAGCGGGSGSNSTAALGAKNLNIIFVASPDLAYPALDHPAHADINRTTANLTSQGLQRSLQMATFLKQQVLGGENVNGIYALSPMTHLQTANNYPDMASIGFIQQFALLNKSTFSNYTGNSFPINVAYAQGSVPVPDGVIEPVAGAFWPGSPAYGTTSTGLDFNNTNGNNDTLVSGIISNNQTGYHVFSAPWETISALMSSINAQHGYNLNLPTTYMGPNYVYAISIPTAGCASLVTYNSNLNPPATYPVLPTPVASAACTHSEQSYFKTVLTGGVGDVQIPSNANTNQRVYIVRHADAHPDPAFKFEDGNYVAAGQWRALALSNALRGKISPNMVYSIDPAQWFPVSKTFNVSYVRPSLTILPYAIDNNLPFSLVSSFELGVDPVDQNTAQTTSNFFFTGGTFSNQTILLAWESGHIRPLLNALIATYSATAPLLPTAQTLTVPKGGWPSSDYDTIWTVILDAQGNLTVDNELCEGIDSTKLPATAPLF
ncbi:MAG: hypothetical protein PHF56_21510 [Desulfuromonadaceae bacterium]|nr:hypothetical protein [Desulfuromonadaceae bacterium]